MFLVDVTYLSNNEFKKFEKLHEFIDFDDPVQILKDLQFVVENGGPIISIEFCVED